MTKECAQIAVGLTGIELKGSALKISRPNNYAANQSKVLVDCSSLLLSKSVNLTTVGGGMERGAGWVLSRLIG